MAVFLDRSKCNGCGICVEVCPLDVLRMDDDERPFAKYENECWYCGACEVDCPTKALKLKLPYLIR